MATRRPPPVSMRARFWRMRAEVEVVLEVMRRSEWKRKAAMANMIRRALAVTMAAMTMLRWPVSITIWIVRPLSRFLS